MEILQYYIYNLQTRTEQVITSASIHRGLDTRQKMATEWQFAFFKQNTGPSLFKLKPTDLGLLQVAACAAFASCYSFDRNCWKQRISEQTTVNGSAVILQTFRLKGAGVDHLKLTRSSFTSPDTTLLSVQIKWLHLHWGRTGLIYVQDNLVLSTGSIICIGF